MGQQGLPEDTFRTHLGDDGGRAARMIKGLNVSHWSGWYPGNDISFRYQEGSGYGDYNDKIIPAPKAQYDNWSVINKQSAAAQQAQKNSGIPALLVALRVWWKGE